MKFSVLIYKKLMKLYIWILKIHEVLYLDISVLWSSISGYPSFLKLYILISIYFDIQDISVLQKKQVILYSKY